jgi:beta-galactosidase
VAVLHSYDSRWAIDFQPHSRNYDQLDVLLGYYAALRERQLTVDIVSAEAPLDRYKLVVAPSLNVISATVAARLLTYVQNGGHLVLGPRSGMKDEHNSLNVQRQPGPLVDALGGRVEQFYALEAPVPVSGSVGTGTAVVWAEQLSTQADKNAGEILLRYGKANGWLDGQPAMISRRVGNGRITYLGAVLDPALMRSTLQWMTHEANIEPEFGALPADVEVCRRVGKGRVVFVLINHGAAAAHVELPAAMWNVLGDQHGLTEVALDPQGVAVLESDVH